MSKRTIEDVQEESAEVVETETEQDVKKARKGKTVIWADGCFDLFHWGHANALRQSRQLGDYLIVGVHSDAEILKNKGPTLMNERERYEAVRACKWVDEVVEDAPYVTSLDFVNKYDVDYVAHGDDISLDANGNDCYQEIKDAGRMRTFQRAKGVSTTEVVGRLLLLTKDHHVDLPSGEEASSSSSSSAASEGRDVTSPYTRASKYLPTTNKIVQFSNGRAPKDSDRVVYVDGSFDMFHVGHIRLLEKAKKLGDFLLVGIHSDSVSNQLQGSNFPILNMQERVLSVLACRAVDEVVIGAPYMVTREMIESNNISLVVHGSLPVLLDAAGRDPYAVPKELGIYREVESEFTYLTARKVLERIRENHERYEARNSKKEKKEVDYIKEHGDMEKVDEL